MLRLLVSRQRFHRISFPPPRTQVTTLTGSGVSSFPSSRSPSLSSCFTSREVIWLRNNFDFAARRSFAVSAQNEAKDQMTVKKEKENVQMKKKKGKKALKEDASAAEGEKENKQMERDEKKQKKKKKKEEMKKERKEEKKKHQKQKKMEKKGKEIEKKELTEELQEGKVYDVKQYTQKLSLLVRGKEYQRAQQMFTEMKERGVTPDIYVYNTMIRCYSELGRLKELLTEMKENEIIVNVETSNALLALIDYSPNYMERVKDHLNKMQEANLIPTTATYNCVLHVLGTQGTLEEVQEWIMVMREQVPLDVKTYNIIMNFYARIGNLKNVLSWYQRMKDEKIETDPRVTINLIRILGREESLEHLEKLRKQLRKQKAFIEQYYVAFIRAYLNCGEILRAIEMFNIMRENSIPWGYKSVSRFLDMAFPHVPSDCQELINKMKNLHNRKKGFLTQQDQLQLELLLKVIRMRLGELAKKSKKKRVVQKTGEEEEEKEEEDLSILEQ